MYDPAPLWYWANERHATYIRKSIREGLSDDQIWDNNYLSTEGGGSLRWGAKNYLTRDLILAEYRFCNVFRELDRVTAWVRYNIRRRYADHPDLWLMLAIARTINWPDALQDAMDLNGWPDNENWEPRDLTNALEVRAGRGDKVYTGAYMIRAESNPKAEWYSWTKHRYIAEIVIGRLWEDRETWRAVLEDQPEGGLDAQFVWEMFQDSRYIGWGPFMAYQVVVDLMHTRYLAEAPDRNKWAALGPGSRRGLNRLYGRPVDYPLSQAQGLEEMRLLYDHQDSWRAPWVPRIGLSDIQNCLCETDKYLRVKLGEGKPRSRYVIGRGY